jgi:hypothetical protein
VAVLVVSLATGLSAAFTGTPHLIGIPTADAQTFGSLLISPSGSTGLNSNSQSPGMEGNLNLSFSPAHRLTITATAYTLGDYVLGASYQLLGNNFLRILAVHGGDTVLGPGYQWLSSNDKPALAVGINDIDIGAHGHVGPIGHDSAGMFPDEQYPNVPDENFSAFVVTSVPVGSVVRLHAGLGRGKYVGYDRGRYLNTDILFGRTHHQWAVGLFGGAEARIGSHASVALDADGRDVNAGVKAYLGPVSVGLALTKIEGFTLPGPDFPRVSAAVSYQLNGLMGGHPKPQTDPVVVVPPKLGTLSGKVVSKTTEPGVALRNYRGCEFEPEK